MAVSLFHQSYNQAFSDLSSQTKRPTAAVPAQSEKMSQLEKELRSDSKDDLGKRANMAAGNAAVPTPQQRRQIQSLVPQDTGFRRTGNKLGDYSAILGQQQTDAQNLVQPMLASTIESKRGDFRLQDANSQYGILSSTFGLAARSNRVWKKAKKNPKMSNQDSWL